MLDLKTAVVVILLFFCVVYMGIGFVLKSTNGLFWSRSIQKYEQDRYNPDSAKEREIGQRMSHFILKYIPAIAVALVIILVMILLNVI